MRLAWGFSLLAALLCPLDEASASGISENVKLSKEGNCLIGPHTPGRIRSLPGQGVPVRPPKNPFEDALPHCASTAADRPAAGRSQGGRR